MKKEEGWSKSLCNFPTLIAQVGGKAVIMMFLSSPLGSSLHMLRPSSTSPRPVLSSDLA
jgi:hypothetical protein